MFVFHFMFYKFDIPAMIHPPPPLTSKWHKEVSQRECGAKVVFTWIHWLQVREQTCFRCSCSHACSSFHLLQIPFVWSHQHFLTGEDDSPVAKPSTLFDYLVSRIFVLTGLFDFCDGTRSYEFLLDILKINLLLKLKTGSGKTAMH